MFRCIELRCCLSCYGLVGGSDTEESIGWMSKTVGESSALQP